MRKGAFIWFLCLALLLGLGCKDKKEGPAEKLSEKELWELAQKEKDIPTCEQYVSDYPSGPHVQEAKKMLKDLWDQKVKSLSPNDIAGLTAVIETDRGAIKFKFFPQDAPNTCRNFIKLAQSHFYDGLIFHRVIDGFVIQGGCPHGNGRGGPGYQIGAEFNQKPHLEGSVAMARGPNPDSAGSQFYICLAPQPRLDRNYTVFGQTVEGMDVVHAIGKTKTSREKPVKPQVMNRVYIEGL